MHVQVHTKEPSNASMPHQRAKRIDGQGMDVRPTGANQAYKQANKQQIKKNLPAAATARAKKWNHRTHPRMTNR